MNTVTERIEQVAAMKGISELSYWTAVTGSLGAFFGWVGSQDVVAGIGAIAVIVGLVLNWWHKRSIQRIEYAKLTPDQRKVYDRS